MRSRCLFFIQTLIIFKLFTALPAFSLEIIRDTELEQFTDELIASLLNKEDINLENINVYFIKSDQVNAFVTGGTNIFINTELIIESDDYREYAAVLAHELAHILGGHIFNTSIELTNLSNRAFPIYLLGIIGIMAGAAETGLAGVMVGQASVTDGFTFYSRTQEASADQAAVSILCKSGINGEFLISFLNKLERMEIAKFSDSQNYRSTHPLTSNRINWINSSLKSYSGCEYDEELQLAKRFDLIRAKLHGFTHPFDETEAVYSSTSETDLYATAVSSYFKGEHRRSIKNLEELIKTNPTNPFYKELLGEIYYANGNHDVASQYQEKAINEIEIDNDLYYMMMGNYLLSSESIADINNAIIYLKKSIQINQKNAYSWYLLARAYAETNQIHLANYATAERYFLIGERKLSYEFAMKASKNIEEYTPEWYRSSDLIEILKKEVSNKSE